MDTVLVEMEQVKTWIFLKIGRNPRALDPAITWDAVRSGKGRSRVDTQAWFSMLVLY